MADISAEQVRTEVSDWVAGAWDPDITLAAWWKLLAASGYASPMLPESLGGRGYPRHLATVVSNVLGEHGVVGPPFGLGLMLAAPTISVHGSPEQQAAYIPRILDGTDSWCQLFSEPGAGSDLAGLGTRAELDGDEYVITGQKVWTSGGQIANWGMLIARTNIDAPKHQGISYFAFSMDQPGVEVRPLREMTGRAMFNEVFIDEARVPVANLIGGLNNGWAVANTTLMVERASLGSGGGGGAGLGSALPGPVAGQLGRRVGEFVAARSGTAGGSIGGGTVKQFSKLAEQLGLRGDPTVRQGLAELHTLAEVGRWNLIRARSGQRSTGVEGNLAKLLGTHTLRRAREIGNHIIGAQGMLWGSDTLSNGSVQEMTVFSPGPAIYGGTDQIQKNIVSERGLGLPKEPGDFRTTPYRELPKNG
ncbi:MAG: acyl-CoA dehydrogenase [Ilumatobacteraceae bacterium]|nr:acyl-CoA dehydrogenase [Ilumatobacteraceae bacterium]MCU1390124.1 acyl-CoA dehydrogenase [Ilumatobacteraceae bacterium]